MSKSLTSYYKNRQYYLDYQHIWRRTLKGRYAFAKKNAKLAKREFSLTFEQFCSIVTDRMCTYCGEFLPETSSGLDRVDSTKGYILGNVVPCCYRCNTMKSNLLSFDEMKLIWAMRRQKS